MQNRASKYYNPTLIRNFNEGEEEAIKEVYEHFKPEMYLYAKALTKNSEESEEIVHDSFIKLIKKKSHFDSLQHIQAYLFVTTRNGCNDWMRKKKVVNSWKEVLSLSETDGHLTLSESNTGEPFWAAMETNLLIKIRALVDAFPPRSRDIFKMYFYENMCKIDIANKLQISPVSVSHNLSKALSELSREIYTAASPNTIPIEREYISNSDIRKIPETKIEIVKYSPSFGILEKILNRRLKIDDLNWREFEKLVAQLLEADGFTIELMQGNKDGGVDIIATKLHDITGYYKTLWQAKKYSKNKVSINTIRELADSVNEFKASKGIIVTSTYLTKDALYRVERDKYILSKVDRIDLDNWINNVLWR